MSFDIQRANEKRNSHAASALASNTTTALFDLLLLLGPINVLFLHWRLISTILFGLAVFSNIVATISILIVLGIGIIVPLAISRKKDQGESYEKLANSLRANRYNIKVSRFFSGLFAPVCFWFSGLHHTAIYTFTIFITAFALYRLATFIGPVYLDRQRAKVVS